MSEAKENKFSVKAKAEELKSQINDAVEKAQSQIKESTDQGQETALKLLRAQLGVYGKIADQLEARSAANKARAEEMYQSLISRGEKVEADAKQAMEDQQKALDEHVDKLRSKFEALKAKVLKNDSKASEKPKQAA